MKLTYTDKVTHINDEKYFCVIDLRLARAAGQLVKRWLKKGVILFFGARIEKMLKVWSFKHVVLAFVRAKHIDTANVYWFELDKQSLAGHKAAKKLADFEVIWFYHNPGRFHRLYKRLLKEAKVKGRIVLFTHKDQIT